MFKEFKEFALKGNVLDLAVGVIIGAAFSKVISSLVADIIMPPIGLILGKVDFASLYVNLSDVNYASLAEAKKAGAPTLTYGLFLNNVLDFVIVAFAIFFLVRLMAVTQKAQATVAVADAVVDKECPFCLACVPLLAKKCGHCTSNLS